MPGHSSLSWRWTGVGLFLITALGLIYGQTLGFAFTKYDDAIYITDNLVVQKGLTWEGLKWSFHFAEIGHWHPFTWLTHMMDCQLYGLWPGGHHLTSVLIQGAAAFALLATLHYLTGSFWKSAWVAAVWTVHPLRVESVAWVAERKDVISGLFFILSLAAYARWIRHPRPFNYVLLLAVFLTGLLCKSMLVTLPFVLLLLDIWPLRRTEKESWENLILEKFPLFALSFIFCLTTYFSPEGIDPDYRMSFWLRVQNSVASYAIYIFQTFWPLNLAVHYPIPRSDLPFWDVTGSLALLLGITWGTFVLRKRHPYLLVGWLWFIGMLVPVIGLMQISTYAYADRYTYLPQIGLLVMMAWGGEEGLRRFRLPAISGVVLTVIGLLFFTALSFRQTSYWKDSESLWRHSVACNGFNAEARYNLGQALGQKGHVDEAIREYKVALEIAPWHANAHNNLGNQFLLSGRWQEAITEYQTALRLNPGNNLARSNLGYALLQRGRTEEAIREYQVVLQLDSANPSSSYQMGLALIQAGQTADAISHYRQTLRLNPSHVQALNNLANVLATTTKAELRNGGESLQLAWKAAELTKGNNPVIMGTMAAAYAELGRYAEAEQTAGTAMELARQQNNPALALMLEQNGKLYHSHQPLRIISSPR